MVDFNGHRDYNKRDFGEVSKRKVFVGNLSFHTSWQNLKDHMKQAGNVEFADIFRDRQGKSKGCGYVEYSTEDEARDAIRNLNETEFEGRTIYVREDRKERSRSREFNKEGSYSKGSFGSRRGGRGGFGSGTRGGYSGDRDTYNSAGGSEYKSGERGGFRRPDEGRFRGYDSGSNQEKYNRSRSRSKSRKENKGIDGYLVLVKGLSKYTSWQDLKDEFKRFGPVVRADMSHNNDVSLGLVYYEKKSDAVKAAEEMNDTSLFDRKIQVKTEI